MDELPSAAFRKVYAKLTAPTRVTVNGHVIGIWTPGGERQPGTFPLTREELGLGTSTILPYVRDPVRDPMREFHPAPKKRDSAR